MAPDYSSTKHVSRVNIVLTISEQKHRETAGAIECRPVNGTMSLENSESKNHDIEYEKTLPRKSQTYDGLRRMTELRMDQASLFPLRHFLQHESKTEAGWHDSRERYVTANLDGDIRRFLRKQPLCAGNGYQNFVQLSAIAGHSYNTYPDTNAEYDGHECEYAQVAPIERKYSQEQVR